MATVRVIRRMATVMNTLSVPTCTYIEIVEWSLSNHIYMLS